MLASQNSPYAIGNPWRKFVRPLVYSLVSDPDFTRSLGYAAAQQFNGFCLKHGILNHSSTARATIETSKNETIETMVASTYQDRLREAMTRADFDTRRLSDEMAISYQAVRKVLIGEAKSFSAVNNARAASILRVNPSWLATGDSERDQGVAHPVNQTRPNDLDARTNVEEYHPLLNNTKKLVPVVGTARLGVGMDGLYEELQHPVGHGDGWIEGYQASDSAYALRVKGDSMHPTIRSGWYVVVEPSREPSAGNFVVVSTVDGRKMVKELVISRQHEIVLESVNGGHRLTLDRAELEWVHPVSGIFPSDSWRPD